MAYPGHSNGISLPEYIEKCTDEHLQQPDYSAFTNICDLVNSSKIDVKETVKAVKKRVKHKKSTVQLLGLALLEMLVKNCYSACVVIGSKEFQQSITKLATNKKTAPEVRMKLLDMIQSFARSFNEMESFPNFETTYVNVVKVVGADAFPTSELASPPFTPPSRPTSSSVNSKRGSVNPNVSSPSSSSSYKSTNSQSSSSLSSPPSNKRYSVGLAHAKDIHEVTSQNLNFLSEIMGTIDVEKEDIRASEVVKELLNVVKQNAEQVQHLINSGSLLSDEAMLSKFLVLNDQIQQTLKNYDEAVATFLEGPKPKTSNPSKPPLYPATSPSHSSNSSSSHSYAPPNPSAPPIFDLDFLGPSSSPNKPPPTNPQADPFNTSPQKPPPTNPNADPFSSFAFPQQTMTYPQLQSTQSSSYQQSSTAPTLAPPQEASKHRGRRSVGNSARPNPDTLPDLSHSFSNMTVTNQPTSTNNAQNDPFAEIAARHSSPAPSTTQQPQLYPQVQQPSYNPQQPFPTTQPFNPFQNPSPYTQPMPTPFAMPPQGYQPQPQYVQGGPYPYQATTPQYYVPQQQQPPKTNPNPFM
eukprot:CAMPEP_0168566496 /NCGR_PEP_ID=MMETSP0413-20121227/14449_1 /TAXON_ID=136452 /ORGANISM="Filamoeba nolandi, Strain NC-AS-23-1" /LENGTH=578 /DNA_ID=CAMNT_0008598517 /DNA_START=71 /DNA_END=1807 /DNA_ORIENTATION=+